MYFELTTMRAHARDHTNALTHTHPTHTHTYTHRLINSHTYAHKDENGTHIWRCRVNSWARR